MVVALGVLLICDNACDNTGWQRGASGLEFIFVTVRVTGYVAVSGCLSCCLTVSVKETGSLLGVGYLPASPALEIIPSWPPGMGHLPPLSVVTAALHSSVLSMPFGVPRGQGRSNSSFSC